jgi:hypothetical protein
MSRAPDGMLPLWQAVVLRAVMDGLGMGHVRQAVVSEREAQGEADQWLREAGWDMRHVCTLAGLDPDAVRDAYLRTLAVQVSTGKRVIFGKGVRAVDPRQRPERLAA